MVKKFLEVVKRLLNAGENDHTSAYAAMSAFFFVLSMIPIILLLLTLIQYTPVTKIDVMKAVAQVVPKSVNPAILMIVDQVYMQSVAVIPVTVIAAMWSAGRGVLAMTAGLNWIYQSPETRNYIFLRIRSTFYTVLFILVIVLSLVVLGFGNSISLFVEKHIPIAVELTRFLIQIRAVAAFLVLTLFSLSIYLFLPNKKQKVKTQIPGALFTAVGWMGTSFFISKYMEIFKGFEDMYGSLTTIILIMLWLYFSMYIMLLGGRINENFRKIAEKE